MELYPARAYVMMQRRANGPSFLAQYPIRQGIRISYEQSFKTGVVLDHAADYHGVGMVPVFDSAEDS